MTDSRKCPECGGDNLEWSAQPRSTSSAADGRLRMSEIAVDLVLGCLHCSGTAKVVNADSPEGMRMLNPHRGPEVKA